jgi:hypothetical protein
LRRLRIAIAGFGCAAAIWAYSVVPRTRNSPPWYLRSALDEHSAFTLLTLDPVRETGLPPKDMFGPWPVIGVATLARPQGAALREVLAASVARRWQDYPSCFEPRHALRRTVGPAWSQFLVCFECAQMETKLGLGPFVLARDHVVLSVDRRELFNRLAASYGLPVAPPVAGPRSRG